MKMFIDFRLIVFGILQIGFAHVLFKEKTVYCLFNYDVKCSATCKSMEFDSGRCVFGRCYCRRPSASSRLLRLDGTSIVESDCEDGRPTPASNPNPTDKNANIAKLHDELKARGMSPVDLVPHSSVADDDDDGSLPQVKDDAVLKVIDRYLPAVHEYLRRLIYNGARIVCPSVTTPNSRDKLAITDLITGRFAAKTPPVKHDEFEGSGVSKVYRPGKDHPRTPRPETMTSPHPVEPKVRGDKLSQTGAPTSVSEGESSAPKMASKGDETLAKKEAVLKLIDRHLPTVRESIRRIIYMGARAECPSVVLPISDKTLASTDLITGRFSAKTPPVKHDEFEGCVASRVHRPTSAGTEDLPRRSRPTPETSSEEEYRPTSIDQRPTKIPPDEVPRTRTTRRPHVEFYNPDKDHPKTHSSSSETTISHKGTHPSVTNPSSEGLEDLPETEKPETEFSTTELPSQDVADRPTRVEDDKDHPMTPGSESETTTSPEEAHPPLIEPHPVEPKRPGDKLPTEEDQDRGTQSPVTVSEAQHVATAMSSQDEGDRLPHDELGHPDEEVTKTSESEMESVTSGISVEGRGRYPAPTRSPPIPHPRPEPKDLPPTEVSKTEYITRAMSTVTKRPPIRPDEPDSKDKPWEDSSNDDLRLIMSKLIGDLQIEETSSDRGQHGKRLLIVRIRRLIVLLSERLKALVVEEGDPKSKVKHDHVSLLESELAELRIILERLHKLQYQLEAGLSDSDLELDVKSRGKSKDTDPTRVTTKPTVSDVTTPEVGIVAAVEQLDMKEMISYLTQYFQSSGESSEENTDVNVTVRRFRQHLTLSNVRHLLMLLTQRLEFIISKKTVQNEEVDPSSGEIPDQIETTAIHADGSIDSLSLDELRRLIELLMTYQQKLEAEVDNASRQLTPTPSAEEEMVTVEDGLNETSMTEEVRTSATTASAEEDMVIGKARLDKTDMTEEAPSSTMTLAESTTMATSAEEDMVSVTNMTNTTMASSSDKEGEDEGDEYDYEYETETEEDIMNTPELMELIHKTVNAVILEYKSKRPTKRTRKIKVKRPKVKH